MLEAARGGTASLPQYEPREAGEGGVGIAIFAGEAAQGGCVLGDGGEIAAGQGASPGWMRGRARAQALEIFEGLTGEREERAYRGAAREAE